MVVDHVSFIRMEASTNLIGGQPLLHAEYEGCKDIADKHGLMIVLDASLIGENAYFIKKREAAYNDVSIKDILNEMCAMSDIVYFSSRKVSSTRGGGIVTDSEELMLKMRDLIPLLKDL